MKLSKDETDLLLMILDDYKENLTILHQFAMEDDEKEQILSFSEKITMIKKKVIESEYSCASTVKI